MKKKLVRDDLDLNKLFQLNAIPDDRVIASWKPLVKAIALSHCHFDHVCCSLFGSAL